MITEIKLKNGKIETINSLSKFKSILEEEQFGYFNPISIYGCEARQNDGEWIAFNKESRKFLIDNNGDIAEWYHHIAMLEGKKKKEQEDILRAEQEASDARAEELRKLTVAIEKDWTIIGWEHLQSVLCLCASMHTGEYECHYPAERSAAEKLLYTVTNTPPLVAMMNTRLLASINNAITENNAVVQALASSNKNIESAIKTGNNTKNMAAGAGLIMASQMLSEMRDSDD
jgi:hypothetical protein